MSKEAKITASCSNCGSPAKGGGYGGFDIEGNYKTFCSPECRTAFYQGDHR